MRFVVSIILIIKSGVIPEIKLYKVMFQSLFVSNAYRATLRKLCAGFLMLSLNLTGGIGALFLTADVAYAHGVGSSLGFSAIPASSTSALLSWTSTSDQANESIKNHDIRIWYCAGAGCSFPSGAAFSYAGTNFLNATSFTSPATSTVLALTSGTMKGGTKAITGLTSGGTYSFKLQEKHGGDIFEQILTNIVITLPQCNDGVDNADPEDTLVDMADPGCSSATDNDESNVVVPPPANNTLTVVKAGTGASSGTVTSAPAGITCGATCVAPYASGTPVTLTAVAAVGSTFTSWLGGGCVGTGICVTTMDAAKTITATFQTEMVALSITPVIGSGTVYTTLGNIISCGTQGTDCTENLPIGTVIVLTASPDSNWNFLEWTGACPGSSPFCEIVMSVARSVGATFTIQPCPTGTTGTSPNCNATPVDVCPNIDGTQETVPTGMELNNVGQCVNIPPPPPQCTENQTLVDNQCVNNPPPTPVCTENQTLVENVCVNNTPPPPQCTENQTLVDGACVNNPPPAPPSGGGGGGSSTFDYWGCTNPSASNFNSLANRDDNSCIISGGSGGVTPTPPLGEVLGAATTEPELPLPAGCSAHITNYMKLGKKTNDVEDVKRLQSFLNETMSANLPVTGYFGTLTKKWVKKFQVANSETIIKPWIDAGFSSKGLKEGTGVVYKTTKHAINLMKCASLNEPMPSLVGDQGLQ